MAAKIRLNPSAIFTPFNSYALLLFLAFSANQISSGAGLGQSSNEPRYAIEFHSAESAFLKGEGQESMIMSKKDGRKYECILPLVDQVKLTNEESARRAKLKNPDEYLEPLKDKCIYYREGWWVYELCHEKRIRQFHLDGEKITQEFVLGEFDPDSTFASNKNLSDLASMKDPRYKYGSQRYHVHQFKNGTVCDLTDQSRETEVRFVCGENKVAISSVKEVSTCKYEIIVQCSLICHHPMFHSDRPVSHVIHCNELAMKDKAVDAASKQVTIVKHLEDDEDVYFT